MMPMWHHHRCFWDRKKGFGAESIEQFKKFELLRPEDQSKLQEKLKAMAGADAPKGGKGPILPKMKAELKVELAKSNR